MRNKSIFSTPPRTSPVPRPKTEFGMPSSWRGPESDVAARGIDVDVEMREPGIMLVRAAGALNGHTYNQLIDTLRDLFGRGMYRLVIDLTGVEQISSAGAAACAAAVGIATDNDGQVALCTPSRTVRRFLTTLGIDALATVSDDADSAIAELRTIA